MPCRLYAWLLKEHLLEQDGAEPYINAYFNNGGQDYLPDFKRWWQRQVVEEERQRRAEAARKGWETRRANAARRKEAAQKAAETRRVRRESQQMQERLAAAQAALDAQVAERRAKAKAWAEELIANAMKMPDFPMLAERSVLMSPTLEEFLFAEVEKDALTLAAEAANAEMAETREARAPSPAPSFDEARLLQYLREASA